MNKDNLIWYLEDVADCDSDQIEDGEFEIQGETENGLDGVCTIKISELCSAALKEIAELRWLLCVNYAKQPYLDDGEMQDGSALPVIDFKRDSIKVIKKKMSERIEKLIKDCES